MYARVDSAVKYDIAFVTVIIEKASPRDDQPFIPLSLMLSIGDFGCLFETISGEEPVVGFCRRAGRKHALSGGQKGLCLVFGSN